ncbi:MAG: hypothetical protein U0T82_16415 [Bacteroidales bacterium]
MNEPDKNKMLLEELIRKREEETDAFRKLLKAIQLQQKSGEGIAPPAGEESPAGSTIESGTDNTEI